MNWYGHRNATTLSMASSWPPLCPSPLLAAEADLLPPVRGFLVLGYLLIVVLGVPRLRQPAHGNRSERPPLHAGGVPSILLSTLPLTLASVIVSRPKEQTRRPPGRRP